MLYQRLDVEKAIQVAGRILQQEGRHISRLRLVKLMYLVDRESLRRRGLPVLGSRLVAMDHGPLHSDVYDLIKGAGHGAARWADHFSNSGMTINLDLPTEAGRLSAFERELIDEIVSENRETDEWKLSQRTHEFEEWKEAYQDASKTSRPIDLVALIRAVGREADKESILDDMRAQRVADDFFHRHGAGT